MVIDNDERVVSPFLHVFIGITVLPFVLFFPHRIAACISFELLSTFRCTLRHCGGSWAWEFIQGLAFHTGVVVGRGEGRGSVVDILRRGMGTSRVLK